MILRFTSRTILFIALITVASSAVLLWNVQPAAAATYTVTTTTDENDGATNCDDVPADCSLREAILAANTDTGNAHTINLPAGTFLLNLTTSGEDLAATGDLDVIASVDVTIVGQGAGTTIIDGNETDRVFDVKTGASLKVQNVTIQNGKVTGSPNYGGGIRAVSATITIENSTFTSNEAFTGAGVYVAGSTLTVSDSTLSYNNAESYAGGLEIYNTTATIDNTTINNNTTSTGPGEGGGGIEFAGGGTLGITDSTIINNSADTGGGGIAQYSSAGPLTIDSTIIRGNDAGDYPGGGIASEGGDLTVTNSEISGNDALYNGNGYGAGIEFYSSDDLTLQNNTFTGNSGADEGAGLYVVTSGTVKIRHNTFANNTAADEGGGVYFGYNVVNATMDFANNLLYGNTSTGFNDDDCFVHASGAFTSDGYNSIGTTALNCSNLTFVGTDKASTNPLFAATGLTDNGGDTQTVALQSSSPAKDYIPAANCLDTAGAALTRDQRGAPRPENTKCDIGAFEIDQTKPAITVTGASTVSNECSSAYLDGGATVTDNFTGSVSSVNTDASGVDTATPGSYSVDYSATDLDGNTGTASRTVNVVDTIDPVATLTGDASITIKQGPTYEDAGATATDSCDKTTFTQAGLSAAGTISTDDQVNPKKLGTYQVIHTVTDASGNTDTVTRTVKVVTRGAITKATAKTNNRVTLTYKDGSSFTCQAFTKGSAKPKVKLAPTGKRVIVLKKNGKKLRSINARNCVVKSTKKVRRQKQAKVRLGIFNFYKKNKKNEVVVATKKNGILRTTSYRLTSPKKGSSLSKKNTKRYEPFTRKKFKIKRKDKRVRITTRKGKTIVKYHMGKKARLNSL